MQIIQMNLKAYELGMVNTFYDDPSGLSRMNKSTAKDLTIIFLIDQKASVLKIYVEGM